MPVVSLTRLRLRSLRFVPRFFWMNEASVRQLARANGFRGAKLLWDRHLTFWTASLWDSDAAMRAFRDTDAHRRAMPKLMRWCDEAAVARMADAGVLPTWPEAHFLLRTQGRATRVQHPSIWQAALDYPPPRPFVPERIVAPAAPPS
jgi:hypothetical protein